MKKPNRRRDILLQRKRETQRLRKQTKPDHQGMSWRQMETDKPGFNIFGWLSRKTPEEKAVLDRRERRAIKQGNR